MKIKKQEKKKEKRTANISIFKIDSCGQKYCGCLVEAKALKGDV